MTTWIAPQPIAPLHGTVVLSGSKSASARALVLAALAQQPSVLRGVLDSRDTQLMRDGLTQLGATFTDIPGQSAVRVQPIGQVQGGSTIDVGLAGTVLRFLPPIAALAPAATTFIGDPEASARPVAPLLEVLCSLGARVSQPFHTPFSISGGQIVSGGDVELDSSASSQFLSALLLAGARYGHGLRVRLTGSTLPSRPHVRMTTTMLDQRGVHVTQPDPHTWVVHPGPIAGIDQTIEPDLTNAATFLAAAVITGGKLTTSWPEGSVQATDQLALVLTAFGATMTYLGAGQDRTLTVSGPATLTGADLDLSAISEFTPVAAALATVASGESHLYGVEHIRGHETDRLAALTAELSQLGVEVIEEPGGLIIRPKPRYPVVWHSYADHRMAHAGALIGLVTPGLQVDDIACTTKTMPDFPQRWADLIGHSR